MPLCLDDTDLTTDSLTWLIQTDHRRSFFLSTFSTFLVIHRLIL